MARKRLVYIGFRLRIIDAFAGDILEALRSLPGEFRTAVYLHEIENFSIAEIMGVHLELARHRVHEGREQLRLVSRS
jgi:DNA-directed RNA polymerase specialized sigma24 family protein